MSHRRILTSLLVAAGCAGEPRLVPADPELAADELPLPDTFYSENGVVRADEITERRSASSYAFQKPDGSVAAVLLPGVVNYRDAGRLFRPIRTAVEPWQGGGEQANALLAGSGTREQTRAVASPFAAAFANRTNTLRSYFGRAADTGILAGIDADGDGDVDAAVRWTPAFRVLPSGAKERARAAPASAAGAALVRYDGTYTGLVEEYRVLPGALRHDIILDEPLEPGRPDGTLELWGRLELSAGLVPHAGGGPQLGDFSTTEAIELRDRSGQLSFRLGRPLAYERDNARVTAPVEYRVRRGATGEIMLALAVAGDWLAAPERHYPVVIDPDIVTSSATYSTDASLSALYPTDAEDWVGISTGTWYRSVARFPIDALPATAAITDVTLRVNVVNANNAAIRIGRITTDPEGTPAATVYAEAAGLACPGCTTFVSGSTVLGAAGARTQSLGATANAALQAAVAARLPWFGLGLARNPESGSQYAAYSPAIDPDPALWPAMVITMNLPPPEAFGLTAPAPGATGVSTRPLLDWEPSPSAVRYRVVLSATPTLVAPLVDTTVPVGATGDSSSLPIGPALLAENTQYYWRVTAENFSGSINNSGGIAAFTTSTHPVAVWRGDLGAWSPVRYQRIQEAIDALGGPNVSGWPVDAEGNAVVIEVRDSSTYNEAVTVDSTKITGTSATRRLALRPAEGSQPTIEYSGSDLYYVVAVFGVSGVTIERFTVRNATSDGTILGMNFRIQNSANSRVRNCRIYGSEHYGIFIDGTSDAFELSGSHIFDNINRSAVVVDGGTGIVLRDNVAYRNGSRGMSLQTAGIVVQNNLVYENADANIRVFALGLSIVSNTLARAPYGITLESGGGASVRNNIFYGHTTAGAQVFGGGSASIDYNLWFANAANGGGSAAIGANAVLADPLFVDVPSGDYHVHSRFGHVTNANPGLFVNSTAAEGTSPAIDAGDPAADFQRETSYNGQRLNLGAYGNTAQASRSNGAPHLLLSEIGVRPADEAFPTSEYIEIYNPTSLPISLDNYYLTDRALEYIDVPSGMLAFADPGDFVARFPAGSRIGPGEYQLIAVDSAALFAELGQLATYELSQDGIVDQVYDMRLVGTPPMAALLDNVSEGVTLFRWDQASDLVADADAMFWGSATSCPNKSAQMRDGPDPDLTPTSYLMDACSATVLAAPAPLRGYRRLDFAEGAEARSGGNGTSGHDETSENLATTWAMALLAPTSGGGECFGQPDGTACGDSASSECDLGDSCRRGLCAPNMLPAGAACSDTTSSDCFAAQCDGAGLCDQTYAFSPPVTVCRADNGLGCDVPEQCSGMSGSCPPDLGRPSGSLCRTQAGACDVAESCNGTSAACPADGFAPAGSFCTDVSPSDCNRAGCDGAGTCRQDQGAESAGHLCRPTVGDCDVAESCDGTSRTCPTDAGVTAGTVCRPSTGECDQAESCTGAPGFCPPNGFAAAGTSCTDASPSDCNDARCNGSGACNQSAAFESGSYVCRADNGLGCDVEERCSGTSGGACPADVGLPNTTICRAAAGDCDVAERCNGTSAPCPTDGFAAANTLCADADESDCDDARCDGSGACSQSFAIEGATHVCRPANSGGCDVAESCDGASGGACPQDLGVTSGTECRASTGECDPAESCDGSGAPCPANAFHAATTPCSDVTPEDCDDAECDGSGACVQAFGFEAATYVCRADNLGGCDEAERCPGGSGGACPADLGVASGTECRAAAGECDEAETCDGTGAPCPNDAFAAPGATCTAQGICFDGACDGGGACSQIANSAPCDDADACTFSDTCQAGACGGTVYSCDDGNVCTDDACDGAGGCSPTFNTSPCDDADACTRDDVCGGGTCAGAAYSCDDANPCTDDTCLGDGTCDRQNNSAPCDDGVVCTSNEACVGGACSGSASTCPAAASLALFTEADSASVGPPGIAVVVQALDASGLPTAQPIDYVLSARGSAGGAPLLESPEGSGASITASASGGRAQLLLSDDRAEDVTLTLEWLTTSGLAAQAARLVTFVAAAGEGLALTPLEPAVGRCSAVEVRLALVDRFGNAVTSLPAEPLLVSASVTADAGAPVIEATGLTNPSALPAAAVDAELTAAHDGWSWYRVSLAEIGTLTLTASAPSQSGGAAAASIDFVEGRVEQVIWGGPDSLTGGESAVITLALLDACGSGSDGHVVSVESTLGSVSLAPGSDPGGFEGSLSVGAEDCPGDAVISITVDGEPLADTQRVHVDCAPRTGGAPPTEGCSCGAGPAAWLSGLLAMLVARRKRSRGR